MENIFELSVLYNKFKEIHSKTVAEVSYRLDKYDGRRFEKAMEDIKVVLLGAPDQLEQTPMGGCGILLEEVKCGVKNRLCRMELLYNEVKIWLHQGTDQAYWRKLAKDLIRDSHLFSNLQNNQEICSVEKVNLRLIIDRYIEGITSLLLLEDSNPYSVLVVPIDYSLARAIFHNERVQKHFDIKCWVCIFELSIANIVWKVVEEAQFGVASFEVHESKSLKLLLSEFERELGDKRLMLVLDQLSEEGCLKGSNWFDLLEPLLSVFTNCKTGSKILITSSARLVDHDFHPNILHATSIMASILSSEPTNLKKLKHFNDLALSCVNNPVQSFQSAAGLMDQLDADAHPLLTYSCLFPLGYKFCKVQLQQLWEVQGFLESVPLKRRFDKCLEKLLDTKYFIQESKRDQTGVRMWYKAQGLMREAVRHLTKEECCLVDMDTNDNIYIQIIQHLSFVVESSWEAPSWLCRAEQLKTLLFLPSKAGELITIPEIEKILASLKALQALDLTILMNCGSCLKAIGELTHLRYLSLGVSVESLPESIINLKFLQTLDLRGSMIQNLPRNFYKLSPRLRHLYTGDKLIDLPPSFGEFKMLQTLDVFVVGQNGLETLTRFFHLAGKLKIRYLYRKEHILVKNPTNLEGSKLDGLLLEWPSSSNSEPTSSDFVQKKDVMELDLLQLPLNLESLAITGWMGETFPQSYLQSNLVSIHIAENNQCKHLPSFSKLGCLKFLELWGLKSLKWIDTTESNGIVSSETPYFSSLEYLSLVNLPQFERWSRVEENVVDDQQCDPWSVLPRLFDLQVSGCPELMYMPQMPSLESLEASNIHETLLYQLLGVQSLRSLKLANFSISEPLPRSFGCLIKLKELSLCWLHKVRVLPESIGELTQLHQLVIRYLPDLLYLPESLGQLSALQHVEIRYCLRLKQLPQTFSELKYLRRLEIKECVKLERRCQQPNGQDWALIQHIPNIYLG
ncbi:hypothetical protein BVRB_2g043940 [Beta vulgaris subsp. vulgaris]|nr:hypothetical protein BVRB_2g043940 [Beta vulgaris subsp. vulgaris]